MQQSDNEICTDRPALCCSRSEVCGTDRADGSARLYVPAQHFDLALMSGAISITKWLRFVSQRKLRKYDPWHRASRHFWLGLTRNLRDLLYACFPDKISEVYQFQEIKPRNSLKCGKYYKTICMAHKIIGYTAVRQRVSTLCHLHCNTHGHSKNKAIFQAR